MTVLVLGGTGRVGRALARVWPGGAARLIWQHRETRLPPGDSIGAIPPGLVWAMDAPLPETRLPKGLSALLVLAGVTRGTPDELGANLRLAQLAQDLAHRAGIGRVVVASSQAVYGRATGPQDESAVCAPASPYGAAKYAMEQALADDPAVCSLRIGNVAGSDALLLAAAAGPVRLDRFADGQSPRRSYIGPVTLARVLDHLLNPDLALPPVLNVANPGLVAMADILGAAGLDFASVDAPPTALPELELDVTRLLTLMPLPPVRAADLVAEARAAGWHPA